MEFKYNMKDLKFILKEWLPVQEVLECERFKGNFSLDDIDILLNEAYKVACEVVSPINAKGDEIGVKFENGIVIPAPGYKEAFKFIQINGWGSSSECIELEGGMPLTIYKAVHEMNACACPALASYIKLTSGAVNLIIRFGTEKDKTLFLPKMLNGDWQGTMCLTEPSAGSDVGDTIARATPTHHSRIYKIKGTKMFITGGDSGLCENTIHMVLARPEGGASGSPGLGLYIVPRIWIEEDGRLGKYNDVTTIGLEHKMGLKAQATALLSFGDNDECYGIKLGPPPDENGISRGLAMMFHMMNESRIGTGHNANCQATAAYFYAAQYAAERVQGRPFGERNAERVPIIEHEDVRRMLLDLKAHTEGIRAMIFKGFYYLDIHNNSKDIEKAIICSDLAAIITPLVKCYGSEVCLNLIAEAMQIFGGVGYTSEYPIEQYMRDSKILTVWEGTSFMHGNDLVGRKMRMKDGKSFALWLLTIRKFIELNQDEPGFQKEMKALKRGYDCLEEIKSIYDSWYSDFKEKKKLIPLYAVKTLFICAQVQVAECLMEQALIAKRKLSELTDHHHDRSFYEGKIASARYYLGQVLPKAYMAAEIIKNADTIVLECPEAELAVS